MNTATTLSKILPSAEKLGNPVRDGWNHLHWLPGGKRLFSRLVGAMAPHTNNIGAQVVALKRGHAEVLLRDHRGVRDHQSCVRAVALVSLAEITGSLALTYCLRDDTRFDVAVLAIEYLKEARGPITGLCQCPIPESNHRHEVEIHVSLMNVADEEVAHATLQALVGPKPSAMPS